MRLASVWTGLTANMLEQNRRRAEFQGWYNRRRRAMAISGLSRGMFR